MKKTSKVQVTSADGENVFIEVDGVTIAQRGKPGTPQARTWVSIEPGWKVIDAADGSSIAIEHEDVKVH